MPTVTTTDGHEVAPDTIVAGVSVYVVPNGFHLLSEDGKSLIATVSDAVSVFHGDMVFTTRDNFEEIVRTLLCGGESSPTVH